MCGRVRVFSDVFSSVMCLVSGNLGREEEEEEFIRISLRERSAVLCSRGMYTGRVPQTRVICGRVCVCERVNARMHVFFLCTKKMRECTYACMWRRVCVYVRVLMHA